MVSSITTGVSLLGHQSTQTNRLKDLASQLADLERQATTQKKSDTYSGLGSGALSVQRYRADVRMLETYKSNAEQATIRTNAMSVAMEQTRKLGHDLMGTIRALRGVDADVSQLTTLAQQGFAMAQDMVNLQIGDRYLFTGTDTPNAPYPGGSDYSASLQADLVNWLSGAMTTAQLTGNIESATPQDIGYSTSIMSAAGISVRIDDHVDVDYTVMADTAGFQDILKGLALASNLPKPDPSVDVATDTDYQAALDYILEVTQRGVDSLLAANTSLTSKAALIGTIQERHIEDITTLQNLVAKIENIDPAEAIVKMNAVQTQMQASYQITAMLSKLSLINFM